MTLPAGYTTYAYEDPFEDFVGPMGYKVEDDRISFAFPAQPHHRNTSDTLHGGILMTFADYALCLTATWDQPGERCVTVSFHCEFVAAGRSGDLVESTCEVVRRTRSLTFVRGTMSVADRVLLSFGGIVKRLPGERS
jgi:uncharacterized protein (TIGR00369 family)